MALRLAADRPAAEDLVQQTLLQGWQGFDGFRADTDARAWLFRILQNAFYAQGRKIRATPVIIPMAVSEDASPLRSRSSSALDAAEINQAFEALNLDYRTVLYLNVVEGFTCREVAAILSVPIGTVMSRLSRARQAFRAWFTPGGSKFVGSATEVCARESR